MWGVRLFLERWRIVFVAPVLVYAGYTWMQAAVLTALATLLAEVLFAIVAATLLSRW